MAIIYATIKLSTNLITICFSRILEFLLLLSEILESAPYTYVLIDHHELLDFITLLLCCKSDIVYKERREILQPQIVDVTGNICRLSCNSSVDLELNK